MSYVRVRGLCGQCGRRTNGGRAVCFRHAALCTDCGRPRSVPSRQYQRSDYRCQQCKGRREQEKYGTLERNRQIVRLRSQGLSYAAIGKRYGIARQRVQQVTKREGSARNAA